MPQTEQQTQPTTPRVSRHAAPDRTAVSVAELLAEYDTADACIAELLCDRHDPEAVAFVSVREAADGELEARDVTYGELRARSEAVAAALASLGVGEGDSVATLMGKSVDLLAVMLGAWRLGAVYLPLFTAFAWPAIEMRLSGARAKVVVCDADQREKIESDSGASLSAGSAAAPAILVAGEGVEDSVLREGDRLLRDVVAEAEAAAGGALAPESFRGGGAATMALLFTSGTTGKPKGVVIPTRALASFHSYMEIGLDVAADDVFWNAADPGWAYGLYYGLMGPMAIGVPNILLEAKYSPPLAVRVFEKLGVTNFAAAPTVYRTLRAHTGPDAGPGPVRLRCASSAGEPLTPEIGEWSERFFGTEVRDHYGQTEHGMFIVNAWHPGFARPMEQGSMGQPLPGWECAVLDSLADEPLAEFDEDGMTPMGPVAIDSPESGLKWFGGYLDAPEKTAERYSEDGRWYYTGDAGRRTAEDSYFFASRDDDVIIMAGYRIGPFDVESVLSGHPEVVESAVVGAPDELRGEVLEAFVVLRGGVPADEEAAAAMSEELQQLVKTGFAAHAYPRSIHFVEDLPKTPSGKIQRFLLRKQRAEESRA
ncbi:AMP-binding protein [Dietzia sp.]|uniref:AMP-binding protein n=1 Tax=Dietzia sp. TaxID=1871616 RepID=UPI002FD90B3A